MPMTMTLMGEREVEAYLTDYGLTEGFVRIDAALLGRGQMSSGQPALMLVIQVDGKHVLVKTSLQMMETICSTMRAACGLPRGP